MKIQPFILSLYTLICLGALPAHAIILLGKNNSENQTDPGTGVPWDSVGRLSNADGSTVGGSGIYLGNGYMLTANHVGPFASVTFDGNTFYTHDGVPPIQVASNVDMKIFHLTTMPTVAAVTLYAGSNEQVADATIIGWGVGRADDSTIPTPLDADPYATAWDLNKTTVAKRWGLNTPEFLANVSYGTGSYQAIVTTLGYFDENRLDDGANEAAVTLLDSGSGLFQFLSGKWQLIGLTTGVEDGSYPNSTFETDGSGNETGTDNYFARISPFSTQINALIPEPSTFLLSIPSLLFLLRRRR